jgi:hypothetical protein
MRTEVQSVRGILDRGRARVLPLQEQRSGLARGIQIERLLEAFVGAGGVADLAAVEPAGELASDLVAKRARREALERLRGRDRFARGDRSRAPR